MQQKGGIGLRGPGETKLEYDKRRLRLRISKLEKEIDQVKKERSLRRARRGQIPLPQIAIVGYTNAGKSTLLNALTRQNAVYADDKLFATLDPTTRRVHMPAGGEMLRWKKPPLQTLSCMCRTPPPPIFPNKPPPCAKLLPTWARKTPR